MATSSATLHRVMYLHLQFTYKKAHPTLENRRLLLPAFLRLILRAILFLFYFSRVALSVSNRGDGRGVRDEALHWEAPTALVRGLTYAEHSPRSVPSNDVYSSTPEKRYVVHP